MPQMLKNYPYFTDWLQELGREPVDVLDFAIQGETIELIPSPTPPFRRFEMTGNYTASITFKDGCFVERPGKWSDGRMRYVLGEESQVNDD